MSWISLSPDLCTHALVLPQWTQSGLEERQEESIMQRMRAHTMATCDPLICWHLISQERRASPYHTMSKDSFRRRVNASFFSTFSPPLKHHARLVSWKSEEIQGIQGSIQREWGDSDSVMLHNLPFSCISCNSRYRLLSTRPQTLRVKLETTPTSPRHVTKAEAANFRGYMSSDGRRKASLEDAAQSIQYDQDSSDSEDEDREPWQFGWQVAERNLVWNDKLAAKLIQARHWAVQLQFYARSEQRWMTL